MTSSDCPSSLSIPEETRCSLCSSPGQARCSVCLAWYCSPACQARQWPQHRRECAPPPALLAPDLSPYLGVVGGTGDKVEFNKKEEASAEKGNHHMKDKVKKAEETEISVIGRKAVKVQSLTTCQEIVSLEDKKADEEETAVVTIEDSKIENKVLKKTDSATDVPTPRGQIKVQHPMVDEGPKSTSTPQSAANSPIPELLYPPAVVSTQVKLPSLGPGFWHPITPDVANIKSPHMFGVRLTDRQADTEELSVKMTKSPPPRKEGWKVGRNQTLAVCHEGVWFRGVAVEKMGDHDQFSIYLLDWGLQVTAGADQLRPLPPAFLCLPAGFVQVGLAGVGPVGGGDLWSEEVGEVFISLLSVPEYKMEAEFLVQMEGGRWVVNLRGEEDLIDLGDVMVEAGMVERRVEGVLKVHHVTASLEGESHIVVKTESVPESSVIKASVAVEDICEEKVIHAENDATTDEIASSDEENQAAPEENTAPPSPVRIARGSLPENVPTQVSVCFLESPVDFYVASLTAVDKFMSVFAATQSPGPGLFSTEPGSCCLAKDEDCWYRAEVVGREGEVTKVFLLDYGKTVEHPVAELRPLDQFLDLSGLVVRVGLVGLQEKVGGWSKEEVDRAWLLLDGDGETDFKLEIVEKDEMSVVMVRMVDNEGTDLTSLMLEAGIGQSPSPGPPPTPPSRLDLLKRRMKMNK